MPLFFMKKIKAIPFEIIHLNEQGFHLKVNALVNGMEAAFILDTGASQTAFDLEFVQKNLPALQINATTQISSGLGTNDMESFETTIEEFKLGDHVFENFFTAILDLSHVNQTYSKLNLPQISGVIGNDILYKMNALIDYKNKQLWLDK